MTPSSSSLLIALLALPAHGGPPAGFDLAALDDPTAWHTRSRVLLDGPPGCIEVQGRVRIQLSLYSPGGFLSAGGRKDLVGTGRFEGRLDGGAWTQLATTWAKEADGAAATLGLDRFHPITGRLPALPATGDAADPSAAPNSVDPNRKRSGNGEDAMTVTKTDEGFHLEIASGGEAAMGMLDALIDDINPEGTAQYVVWDEARRAVVLTEAVPLDRGQELLIDVVFPEAGVPTRLDATFPDRVRFEEDGIGFTLRDAQLHLRGRETPLGVVPGVEGMSFVAGALGFTLGMDQRVSYDRVRACPDG